MDALVTSQGNVLDIESFVPTGKNVNDSFEFILDCRSKTFQGRDKFVNVRIFVVFWTSHVQKLSLRHVMFSEWSKAPNFPLNGLPTLDAEKRLFS